MKFFSEFAAIVHRDLAMQRDMGSFPLPPGLRSKLHNAGLLVAEDVLQFKPGQLERGRLHLQHSLMNWPKV